MNIKSFIIKIISCVILSAMLLISVASCKKTPDNDSSTNSENSSQAINISEYKIVRASSMTIGVKDYADRLKNLLNSMTGTKIGNVLIDAQVEPSDYEILIGNTNRKESADLLNELEKKHTEGAFAIKATNNKIVFVGFDGNDLVTAIKYFLYSSVKKAESGKQTVLIKKDETFIKKTDDIVYISDDYSQMIAVDRRSTVYTPTSSKLNEACTFGKIIKLENQSDAKNNGILLATKENNAFNSQAGDIRYPIFQSTDDGATWKEIYRMTDMVNKLNSNGLGWQPYLFELPEDVGSFKKGTVIFASSVRTPNTTIALQYSTDCGKTWKGLGNVDIGGTSSDWSWDAQGLWEPALAYEDGRLYCFYSDETDNGTSPGHKGGHCQKLV